MCPACPHQTNFSLVSSRQCSSDLALSHHHLIVTDGAVCVVCKNFSFIPDTVLFYIIIAKRIYNVIQSPAELNQTHPDASHLIITSKTTHADSFSFYLV